MTATTVWINGTSLGEYKGGYTPFSFDLTSHLKPVGENVLTVYVDSTERADIPPFGNEIDYLTFGGIYREVSLRIVPQTYLDNIFARTKDVLTSPALDVDCFLAGAPSSDLTLEVELRDGENIIAKSSDKVSHTASPDPNAAANPETSAPVHASTQTTADPARHTVALSSLKNISSGDLDSPKLYTVHVRLLSNGRVIDSDTRRIGFREAVFTRRASRSTARSSSSRPQPPPDVSLRRPGDARPCRSARTPTSSVRTCTATSSAPRIIRSRGTFSIAATRSACWSSKRSPAGSTSATKRGSRSPSTTSAG